MEDVKVRQFLYSSGSGSGSGSGDGDGYGYGSGSGSGYGYGYGYGSGDGYGYGSGSGYGYGYGYGSGSGYGDGSGSGDGYGYGSGYGYGYGYGDGYGSGDGSGSGSVGLAEINVHKVYLVDGIATIFTSIQGNVAKGFILQSDLTMTPCYVVKNGSTFAHGDDLHKAMSALRDKMFEDMPEEERIAEFIKEHPDKDKAYPNQDLFDWHNRLTGSCMAGRNAFVKDHGLTLDGETTVTGFIKLTENAYGGDTIKNLDKAYAERVC